MSNKKETDEKIMEFVRQVMCKVGAFEPKALVFVRHKGGEDRDFLVTLNMALTEEECDRIQEEISAVTPFIHAKQVTAESLYREAIAPGADKEEYIKYFDKCIAARLHNVSGYIATLMLKDYPVDWIKKAIVDCVKNNVDDAEDALQDLMKNHPEEFSKEWYKETFKLKVVGESKSLSEIFDDLSSETIQDLIESMPFFNHPESPEYKKLKKALKGVDESIKDLKDFGKSVIKNLFETFEDPKESPDPDEEN